MSQLSQKIGEKVLQKRFSRITRDKSVQNFETAKSAVIIFDTSLPDCLQTIKEFVNYLKNAGIKSSVYGYVPQKENPHEMLLWKNFEFITRKEINWFGSPKGEVAESFYKKKPDILFVICYNHIIPIDFFMQLSEAKFKVGCYTERENDLDLMINTGNKECEVAYFIDQVKHYIKLLNPSN